MTTNAKILTKTLSDKLMREERLMLKCEVSWSGQILQQANYRDKYYDTMKFFQWLRRKKLKNHKKVAVFCMRMFKECGATYKLFKN